MLNTILEILEEFGSGSGGTGEFCAEVRALQLDKARLDYLAGQAAVDRWKARWEDEGGGVWTLHSFNAHGRTTLREAIDKAVKQEEIAQAMEVEDGGGKE